MGIKISLLLIVLRFKLNPREKTFPRYLLADLVWFQASASVVYGIGSLSTEQAVLSMMGKARLGSPWFISLLIVSRCISWWPHFSAALNWEIFRSCMPFYPPPPNGPLVLVPPILVPITSLWVAPGFHEDSLSLPHPCVLRIHLCMCWHAGGSVQTCWLAKQKRVVIASTISVFVEILGSFLCSTTDFLKPCRNIPVGISFCQIWYRLNDMIKHSLCRLECWWAVDVLTYMVTAVSPHVMSPHMWWQFTTKHLWPKTCFPTNVTPAYSHYRLYIGYPLRAFCSVTKLRQIAHNKATCPLPPQPRVHSVLFVHCWRHVPFDHCLYPKWLPAQRGICRTPTFLPSVILICPPNPS